MNMSVQNQPDYEYDETKDLRKLHKAKYVGLKADPAQQQNQQNQQSSQPNNNSGGNKPLPSNLAQMLQFIKQPGGSANHMGMMQILGGQSADDIQRDVDEEIKQEEADEKQKMSEMDKDLQKANNSADKQKIEKVISKLI